MSKAFFIDTTRCTACRGCQVACKQWHKLPAEDTRNWGSHQNPRDLSYMTYKLVRMNETVDKSGVKWRFFPDQCRHCVMPPCKATADFDNEAAILHDERTGAVLFTELTAKTDVQAVIDSCPYNIPRMDPESKILSKCDMCFDRVMNGLKPACVQVCPTGAMNFGEYDEMMDLAKKRLKVVKKRHPKAMLADPDDVLVVFLLEDDPAQYHEFAVAEAKPGLGPLTRKQLFANLVRPVTRSRG